MRLLPSPPSCRDGRAGSADVGGSGEGGFTLIELLVALMIFAMLSAAGVLLLGNSVSAQAQIKVRLDDLAAVQRAGGALAADLGQAAPRISRTEIGTLAPAFWSHREGEAVPVLQFVRGGWDNLGDLPQPSLRKVEYWVRQGRLERRTYAQVDGAAGDEPAALLDNVDEVVLRFRDAQGSWRDEWTPTQPDLMPWAVEMTVTRTGEPPVTLRFLVGPGPAERLPEEAAGA
ncbi:General secretion pathway protein J [Sphingobium herbicidovorans NBRC 16415]|uniref:Type II secretion system protein J n=1 Tax=Sphingobium herbicidovorans (strain ATCC 700291 / DSM 11019 / CCUG 56400 / KCTC 2939 / LMG 18315 / NBRC 16415 / MH) TaxID=1219045 RepID=A0A086P894_SPHHM|nr:type II secretion system minor pseudopilin GspJ [Sphingobium herbicidovorans]KFG89612.1 General secretion pathway protein J [Sphingobium herbicidovorans NBRC 16415]